MSYACGRCRVFKDWSAPNIAHVPLTILHAEDHRAVADAVRDTLEAEGWRVVTCADGAVAVRRLASQAHYDLLITENRLPHVNGLELVRYARVHGRRKGMPIVMLGGADLEAEAWRAGVDAFIKKPVGRGQLVETVRRLLRR